MLAEAVRSVMAQSEPAEIVVVNSGGGHAGALLRRAGLDVRVIEETTRLMPGGTRNRGITATTAPFVAFLAADCLACPGWVAGRVAAHRGGSAMVATSLLPDRLKSPIAWAHHLALFARRLPGTPAAEASLYGVSYARDLFDRFGLFDETLRVAEDTLFNARAGAGGAPVWHPEVCTIHRAPRDPVSVLLDQYRRGKRAGRHLRGQGQVLDKAGITQIREVRTRLSLQLARTAVPPEWQAVAARSVPLIRLAQVAYMQGVARGNRSAPGPGQGADSRS